MDKNLLKEKIIEKISKIGAEIAVLKEMTEPVAPDNAIGRVSRMDAINNKSVMEASLRYAEGKLAGLKYALENIDNENFGICARCKKTIPEGRILLMPESKYCTQCSSKVS